MKQCQDCRTAEPPDHDHDDRPREEWSCNWLDWMVTDGACPHCGGPVIPLTNITGLGTMLDAMPSLMMPAKDEPMA